jgi:hypothetical protein
VTGIAFVTAGSVSVGSGSDVAVSSLVDVAGAASVFGADCASVAVGSGTGAQAPVTKMNKSTRREIMLRFMKLSSLPE